MPKRPKTSNKFTAYVSILEAQNQINLAVLATRQLTTPAKNHLRASLVLLADAANALYEQLKPDQAELADPNRLPTPPTKGEITNAVS